MLDQNSPKVLAQISPTYRVRRSAVRMICTSIFGRTASPLLRRRRCDGCVGTGVFRHQVGVSAQAVAGALDLHDDRVVQQPIQQRGGDDGIAEDLPPLGKAAVEVRIIAPFS